MECLFFYEVLESYRLFFFCYALKHLLRSHLETTADQRADDLEHLTAPREPVIRFNSLRKLGF